MAMVFVAAQHNNAACPPLSEGDGIAAALRSGHEAARGGGGYKLTFERDRAYGKIY